VVLGDPLVLTPLLSGEFSVSFRQPLCFLAYLTFTACASETPKPTETVLVQARARLSSEVDQCSKRYNYDPYTVVGKPQRALLPNELSWRQCAYQAVMNYEKANPALAPLYNSLLEEDNLLTNALMRGEITRSERQAKILQLLDKIKVAEQEQINETRLEQAKKQEQVRNIFNMFRDFGYGEPLR
jgi:hypothetical protein